MKFGYAGHLRKHPNKSKGLWELEVKAIESDIFNITEKTH
jgi:hypothetical protein